jgi:hypothetical protein
MMVTNKTRDESHFFFILPSESKPEQTNSELEQVSAETSFSTTLGPEHARLASSQQLLL